MNNLDLAMSYKCRASGLSDIAASIKKDEVPKGVMTHLKKWILERTHNERIPMANKYTVKGNRAETEAVEFVEEHCPDLGGLLLPNELGQKSNDFFQGTWDVMTPNGEKIIDIKNSFTAETFPFYEEVIPTKGYDLQVGVGYCSISGATEGEVIYCLMNASIDEIANEAARYCFQTGQEESEEIFAMFKKRMTYDHLEPLQRIKRFTVKKDPVLIGLFEKRVIACRSELLSILNKYRPHKI